jgi:hypothetical protein
MLDMLPPPDRAKEPSFNSVKRSEKDASGVGVPSDGISLPAEGDSWEEAEPESRACQASAAVSCISCTVLAIAVAKVLNWGGDKPLKGTPVEALPHKVEVVPGGVARLALGIGLISTAEDALSRRGAAVDAAFAGCSIAAKRAAGQWGPSPGSAGRSKGGAADSSVA